MGAGEVCRPWSDVGIRAWIRPGWWEAGRACSGEQRAGSVGSHVAVDTLTERRPRRGYVGRLGQRPPGRGQAAVRRLPGGLLAPGLAVDRLVAACLDDTVDALHLL